MWKGVYPDDLSFPPHVACIYFQELDFGDLIGRYWKGTTIPACEISECVVIAQRILERKEIEEAWFKEMKKAIEEVREDYLGQLRL